MPHSGHSSALSAPGSRVASRRCGAFSLHTLPGGVASVIVPVTHEFTLDQVDAAIDFVVVSGAEDRGQTVSYSRVFEAASLPSPQNLHIGGESHLVTAFMERFHVRCAERHLPPLDSLVVHVAGRREGFPGMGYFRVNGHPDPLADRTRPEEQVAATAFWQAQRDECRAWGTRSRRGQA